MEPRIAVITLAVDDLDRAVTFYCDGLGWSTEGIVGREFPDGAVAFFDLAGGTKVALWPRGSLARDSGVEQSPRSPTELSLGHNVRSPAEVDAAYNRAVAAGATGIKAPQPTFWGGYAGYVQDPEGHLWELVYNPDLLPDWARFSRRIGRPRTRSAGARTRSVPPASRPSRSPRCPGP